MWSVEPTMRIAKASLLVCLLLPGQSACSHASAELERLQALELEVAELRREVRENAKAGVAASTPDSPPVAPGFRPLPPELRQPFGEESGSGRPAKVAGLKPYPAERAGMRKSAP